MKSKLCLGSVQFGMEYGITNLRGKTPEEEVKQIMSEAYLNNIKFVIQHNHMLNLKR